MSAKLMSRIAIMSALCVVLRMVFSSLPNVQPVTAFLLSYLLYFGLAEAVLVMMLCLFLSAFCWDLALGSFGKLLVLRLFFYYGVLSCTLCLSNSPNISLAVRLSWPPYVASFMGC